MKNKENLFIIGIVLDIIGLLLILCTTLKDISLFSMINNSMILMIKVIGSIIFVVGFILFIIALTMMYKDDNILEKKKDLVIEGKADVITLLVMNAIMLLMLVLCLLLEEYIGAILFGLALLIQNILNTILIKYFSRGR